MARQNGVLILSCNVDFGSSGAPVFTFEGGVPRIVSVVSAKAEVKGQQVALGAALAQELELLQAELASVSTGRRVPNGVRRIRVGDQPNDTGAKSVRP